MEDSQVIAALVEIAIKYRGDLRGTPHFGELTDELTAIGIEVEDTDDGTIWRRRPDDA